MSDFVTLTCPSCGGKLQITDDIDRFACAHCGTEHVVRRGGGLVSLAPVVEGIQQVRMGVDKTASELAIHRLEKEMPELVQQRHKMASQISSAAILGVVLIVLISFVALLLATVVNERLAQGIYVGTVILAIVILVRASIMSTTEREKRCAPIDEKIAGKKAELKRHQRIVSQ
ncbi:MAG: hypothetical protein ABIH46_11345 [Chloroflexota bacterium]